MSELMLDSPIGALKLVFGQTGLQAVRFVDASERQHPGQHRSGELPRFAQTTVEKLRRYFRGEKVNLADVPVEFPEGSPFEKRVWLEVRNVPYGRTISYGELARKVGKPGAARAVGRALGRNPIPIVVPCHRVVRSDGALGGYSAGIGRKVALLKLEGVSVAHGR